MKEMKCYDILTVHAEGKDYAVAAPSIAAGVGDLVEFRVAENMSMVGQVTHQMLCKQFDDAWHTVAAFTRIHDAIAAYSMTWSAETADT